MITLTECIAKGIKVYRHGSKELADLHEDSKDPPIRVEIKTLFGTKRAVRQEYSWKNDGLQYVVDHGGFYTLSTIKRGQVVPLFEFITND